MSDEASRVSCGIDPDGEGKQLGRLLVPHPRDESAWGALPLTIASIKRGEGPRVLLTAGAHGDELEGPLALAELARRLEPSMIRGQVLIVPALNAPALEAGRRRSPIDGKDMNRSFPGEREGSPTSMIAHFVSSVLLPRVEAVLDLHSGGRSLDFLPCAVMHALEDPDRRAATEAAMEAFGAPYALVLEELDAEGMLDSLVESTGKLFLSTELGGGARVRPETMTYARRGVWSLLAHLGVLEAERPSDIPSGGEASRRLEVPDKSFYGVAPSDGLWEPALGLGTEVRAGDLLGRLWPSRGLGAPFRLEAAHDGVFFAERALARTAEGDCLTVLARPLD